MSNFNLCFMCEMGHEESCRGNINCLEVLEIEKDRDRLKEELEKSNRLIREITLGQLELTRERDALKEELEKRIHQRDFYLERLKEKLKNGN